MTAPDERQQILAEVNRLAGRQLSDGWLAAQSSSDFRAYIFQFYPELAATWYSVAADLGAHWYSESDELADYVAEPSAPPSLERWSGSAAWALTNQDALGLLAGSLARSVFDGARDTTILNATSEPGSLWARHASANACGFCRMVATRHVGGNGTYYSSEAAATGVVGRGKEMSLADRRDRAAGRTRRSGAQAGQFLAGGIKTRGSRNLGEKYHDRCHCIAVEIRPGSTYTPPPYVEQWNQDYIDATRQASRDGQTRDGAIDLKVISRLMNPARPHQ